MGFRLTALLQGSPASCASFQQKKCLVFVQDEWAKVGDLKAHMKKVLGAERIEVFIDDCWVPSEEPMCIIKPSDVITVKVVERTVGDASISQANEEDTPEKKKKRTKSNVEQSPLATPEHAEPEDIALAAKKAELLQKVETVLSSEEMDVTDNAVQPTKKRRHRKRPSKKRKELLERLSVGAALSCMTEQADLPPQLAMAPVEVPTGPTTSHHIRFDEKMDQDNPDNTTADVPNEDWQERLLSFAQERKKPVFVRSEIASGKSPPTHQNGDDVDNGLNGSNVNGDDAIGNERRNACRISYVLGSVPTETAKPNDILYFKKLTVVDGTPQVSDYLLASVSEVNDSGALVLKISKSSAGVERNFTPDEIQESEDDYFVVIVDWRHIIEPRLVVDSSLLPKHLG